MIKQSLGAAVLVAATMVPTTASAKPAVAAANCALGVGSVTAGGDHTAQLVVATKPPTTRAKSTVAQDVYTPGQIRVTTSMNELDDGFGGVNVFGYVIGGSTLYASGYHATNGVHDGAPLAPVGGGWGSFVSLEEADYQGPTQTHISRRNTYAMRNDGTLFRWTLVNGAWRYKASAPGFAAVKTMALVSKSATYDTFVATTRGGALYTIHIPTSAPMKPVVKQVRRSTWQGFETLLTQTCGVYGTFLVGIDHDTNTAYAYAIGRFNGPSTVIQGLGKIPATFPDGLYFRWKDPGGPLTGE